MMVGKEKYKWTVYKKPIHGPRCGYKVLAAGVL
jgi:hypothetical protein